MSINLTAVARQFTIVQGVRRLESDRLRVCEPSPSVARTKGVLHVLAEAAGRRRHGADPAALVVAEICKEYYAQRSQSITASLRSAITVANRRLYEENLRNVPEDRALVGVTCAVIRGSALYIAQVLPGQAHLLTAGKTVSFPEQEWPSVSSEELPGWGRPASLGETPGIEVDLHRVEVEGGSFLILCTANLQHPASNQDLGSFLLRSSGSHALDNLLHVAEEWGLNDAAAMVVELSLEDTALERPLPAPVERRDAVRPTGRGESRDERDVSSPLRGKVVLPPATPRPGRSSATPSPQLGSPYGYQATRPRAEREEADDVGRTSRSLVAGLMGALRALRPGKDEAQAMEDEPQRQPNYWPALLGVAVALIAAVLYFVYWGIPGDSATPTPTPAAATADAPGAAPASTPIHRPTSSAPRPTPDVPPTLTVSGQGEQEEQMDQQNMVFSLTNMRTLADFGRLARPGSHPARVVGDSDSLYVLDDGVGIVYRQPLAGGDLSAVLSKNDRVDGQTVGQIVSVAPGLGAPLLMDSNKMLFQYNPAENTTQAIELADRDKWDVPRDMATYDGNLYLLGARQNQITRYLSEAYDKPPTDWVSRLSTVDMSGAIDFAVDGDIYVLLGQGQILSLSRGEVQAFALSGIEQPLLSPAAVFTDETTKHLYVVDAGNKRLLQIDKSGQLVRQLRAPLGDTSLDAIRDIRVDEARNTIYILSNDKLYTATLPEAQEEAASNP